METKSRHGRGPHFGPQPSTRHLTEAERVKHRLFLAEKKHLLLVEEPWLRETPLGAELYDEVSAAYARLLRDERRGK